MVGEVVVVERLRNRLEKQRDNDEDCGNAEQKQWRFSAGKHGQDFRISGVKVKVSMEIGETKAGLRLQR